MRSCQIVPSLEARHGGPSKSVLALARALAETGEEVELLATEPGPGWRRREGPLEIQVFHRGWPAKFCVSAQLHSYLRSNQARVYHHHSLWLRTLHYAHQACRRTGAALVVSPRGMMDPWAWNHHARQKRFARAWVHPRAFERVNGWHATSEKEAADLRSLGFKQPACVAPNGIGAASAEAVAVSRHYWQAVVPDCQRRPIALFYSRFHQKKRLLELIDLWMKCAPPDWLLLVVGIPEEYSAKMIDAYVLRAGGVRRVRAFDGSGLPPPYPIASLFLLPSHGENFGLSIAEALAEGVPALVTDSTPWAELNRNGGGWWVPWAGYGQALRNATSEGPDALRRRGAVGREWVLSEYSWERSARILGDFYRSLTKSP